MYTVVTFASTHQALSVEKAMSAAGIPLEVIPTPRSISANCGLSLKVAEDYTAEVQAILGALGLKLDIYRTPVVGGVYTRLEPEEG